jgi:plastocyanin
LSVSAAIAPLFAGQELVARAVRRDEAAIRTIVRQNNRRLFRVARSILRDDWEAEDTVQEACARVFSHLTEFAETVTVTIDKVAYAPLSVSVRVGDTIEWKNVDLVAYAATARDKSLTS